MAAPAAPTPVARPVTAAPARITPLDSYYRAYDPDTGLALRLKRHRAHLDTPQLCTWFRSRRDAELATRGSSAPPRSKS